MTRFAIGLPLAILLVMAPHTAAFALEQIVQSEQASPGDTLRQQLLRRMGGQQTPQLDPQSDEAKWDAANALQNARRGDYNRLREALRQSLQNRGNNDDEFRYGRVPPGSEPVIETWSQNGTLHHRIHYRHEMPVFDGPPKYRYTDPSGRPNQFHNGREPLTNDEIINILRGPSQPEARNNALDQRALALAGQMGYGNAQYPTDNRTNLGSGDTGIKIDCALLRNCGTNAASNSRGNSSGASMAPPGFASANTSGASRAPGAKTSFNIASLNTNPRGGRDFGFNPGSDRFGAGGGGPRFGGPSYGGHRFGGGFGRGFPGNGPGTFRGGNPPGYVWVSSLDGRSPSGWQRIQPPQTSYRLDPIMPVPAPSLGGSPQYGSTKSLVSYDGGPAQWVPGYQGFGPGNFTQFDAKGNVVGGSVFLGNEPVSSPSQQWSPGTGRDGFGRGYGGPRFGGDFGRGYWGHRFGGDFGRGYWGHRFGGDFGRGYGGHRFGGGFGRGFPGNGPGTFRGGNPPGYVWVSSLDGRSPSGWQRIQPPPTSYRLDPITPVPPPSLGVASISQSQGVPITINRVGSTNNNISGASAVSRSPAGGSIVTSISPPSAPAGQNSVSVLNSAAPTSGGAFTSPIPIRSTITGTGTATTTPSATKTSVLNSASPAPNSPAPGSSTSNQSAITGTGTTSTLPAAGLRAIPTNTAPDPGTIRAQPSHPGVSIPLQQTPNVVGSAASSAASGAANRAASGAASRVSAIASTSASNAASHAASSAASNAASNAASHAASNAASNAASRAASNAASNAASRAASNAASRAASNAASRIPTVQVRIPGR